MSILNQIRRFSLTLLLIFCSQLAVHAQTVNQVIYDNALENGWQNWSWATVDLANTSPTYESADSISVSAEAYQALYLDTNAQSTAPYAGLTFWINGGPTGGQQLQVQALVNGSSQTAYPLAALPANTWEEITIPLSALNAADTAGFDGFWIQNTTGSTLPTFYVDGISLVPSTTSPPAAVSLSINAGQVIRTLDGRDYGLNTAIWDSQLGTPASLSLLQQMQTQILRFPGGSASDSYNWSTNISDGDTWSWAAPFPTFAQLAAAAQAQAMITVNYGSETPQMAAAWVAYANGSPSSTQDIGVDAHGVNWQTVGYWASLRASSPLSIDDGKNFLRINHPAPFNFLDWEIGNECYGSWENDQHGTDPDLPGAPHDAYTYAQYAAQFYTQMKAVDPAIKVGMVAIPGEDDWGDGQHAVPNPAEDNSLHSGWTPVVLVTLASLGITPDFLIEHDYPQNPGDENDTDLLLSGSAWQSAAANLRQMLTDYLPSTGAGVSLLATESNSVSSNPGKQTTSLVNGLFYADSLGSIAQTEFNSCIWWDFRNGSSTTGNNSSSLYGWREFGDYGIVAAGDRPDTPLNTPYPTFYAAQLLTHWARGGDQIVEAASNYSLLSVYAAHLSDGQLALLVINKDPVNNLTGDISLSGFVPGSSTATMYQYGKPQDLADTGLTENTITSIGTSFSEVFPSYSMTVIDLAAPIVSASISGIVSLQGVAAGNMGQPLVFTLTPTGETGGSVTTQTVTLNAQTGAFTLTGIPAGTYTLGVKGSSWLRTDTAINTNSGNVTGLSISLLGGDLNGDNEVGPQDYLILCRAYGSTPGSAKWNAAADISCAGRVSAQDYLILCRNYGKKGDP